MNEAVIGNPLLDPDEAGILRVTVLLAALPVYVRLMMSPEDA